MSIQARVFNSKLYGKAHPNVERFISAQFEMPLNQMGQAQAMFMERAKKAAENYYKDSLLDKIREISNDGDEGSIGYSNAAFVSGLWNFSRVGPFMADTILRHPEIKNEFQMGRIDGYSTLLTDRIERTDDEDNLFYEAVTNGLVTQSRTCDEAPHWGWTNHLQTGDHPKLTIGEQADIMMTWAEALSLIEEGLDPTKID